MNERYGGSAQRHGRIASKAGTPSVGTSKKLSTTKPATRPAREGRG